jgi:hypothetical protein
MKRFIFTPLATLAALLLSTLPVHADRLLGVIAFEYGSTSGTFGLVSPSFTVPVQGNNSNDGIISGTLEYLGVRRWPFELGVAARGSFAISGWNLGAPGVTDSQGYYYPYDEIHIGADWWALAAMGTAHLHLGPIATLDAAIGYGPYGYLNVNYWDDAGIVTGPVVQGSALFPQRRWSLDWSAGLSFRFLEEAALSVDFGMMGPDSVAGLGVAFSL